MPREAWIRGLMASAAGAAVLFITIPTSLGFVLAPSSVKLAEKINPRNAVVQSTLASEELFSGKTLLELHPIEVRARAALQRSPLDMDALRDLAFIDTLMGEDARASAEFRLAGRGTLRDYLTHVSLYSLSLNSRNYQDAVREADIVLRQSTTTWPVFIPQFVSAANGTPISRLVIPMLNKKPLWRGEYLKVLGSIGNPDLAFAIFQELRRAGTPPTTDELSPYFRRLVSIAPAEVVSRQWRSLVSGQARAGLIRDPGFDGLDAPPPFNWILYTNQAGSYVEMTSAADRTGSALHLSIRAPDVSLAGQGLFLLPGRYRLAGQIYRADPQSKGFIGFRVLCGLDSKGRVATDFTIGPEPDQTSPPAPSQWRPFAFELAIPKDCNGQTLWVRAGASDGEGGVDYQLSGLSLTALS